MSARRTLAALMLSALLAACGGSGPHKPKTDAATVASAKPTRPPAATAPARPVPPPPVQALVTAETKNRLLVVDLPSGRVMRTIALPADPEDIAAAASDARGRLAVVTSPAADKVTLLEGRMLRPVKVFAGFGAPHIVELAPVPYGYVAYVTDDARGTVTAIDLRTRRVTSTIHVGARAHHLCFDVRNQMAWVALGESARTIVVLSTGNPDHPQVIGRFPAGFPIHDLACSSGGPRVWLTAAGGSDVRVVDGVDQRALLRVPVGRPPQHVALAGPRAYLTSGYGGTIEEVDAGTGKILARARSPYGSFELAADSRYVVTSSLLRGTLAVYTTNLKLLRVVHLAPATKEVALSPPAGSRP